MRFLLLLPFIVCSLAVASAQEKAGNTFTFGDGKLTLTAPAGWTAKQPASQIVEVEFSVPPAKGDETPGRLTAMGALGSVESNIDRWVLQFAGPGGAAAKPRRDKATVSGYEVEIVDLSGTFRESVGGPVAGGKTITRDNYRMLGAIIQVNKAAAEQERTTKYFLKLTGPKATIDENEKGFQDMVKSLKVK